jgi:signal peptidase I
VKRNDVVVFNIPPKELNEGKNYPVDLKTNYIKRCVAISGDTLTIDSLQVYINGNKAENAELMQYSYHVVADNVINERILEKYDIYDYQITGRPGNQVEYQMFLTTDVAAELKKLNFIKSVGVATINDNSFGPKQRNVADWNIFPNAKMFPWNSDFYGPIVIPAEGMTITIDEKSLATYGKTIQLYDHNDDVKIDQGKLIIDGKEVTQYTFKQNYYFMMGDNRHNSLDSRYWGFVPEDHIVGKAFFIWLSIDRNAGGIRWRRFLNLIE